SSEKKIVGQTISDSTFRELAELIKKFEPPPAINLDRIELEPNKEVIVLTASPRESDVPYVFCGRPYHRIGSTVSQMSQQVYQKLLLERNYHNLRWETEQVLDYTIDDLSAEEIWRT